jgi:NAD-dependent dihydropyrimidine dehydrogenase PreA subunit
MNKRKIIKIDETKCNGCGNCIPNCREGALQIIDGKAKIINDVFCDGLGACLGHCPADAITIIEREAMPFDEAKVVELKEAKLPCGCPGSKVMDLREPGESCGSGQKTGKSASQLRQWPVQITLVPPNAPYLKGADLLIAADCVPFAYPDFHRDLLKGKMLLVGCPKLDDSDAYAEKIAQIIKNNNLKSITYAHMEVPCCYGLVDIIKSAAKCAGKKLPFRDVTIGIKGEMIEDITE